MNTVSITQEAAMGRFSSGDSVVLERVLPGTVEQVFTHFALTLTVYAGSFEGGAPDGHFWVTPEAVGEAGFSSAMRKAVEHALRRG